MKYKNMKLLKEEEIYLEDIFEEEQYEVEKDEDGIDIIPITTEHISLKDSPS